MQTSKLFGAKNFRQENKNTLDFLKFMCVRMDKWEGCQPFAILCGRPLT